MITEKKTSLYIIIKFVIDMAKKLWTREQLIIAVKLYCELPFGKMHKGNPNIISMAKLIGRTPSAVARKLVNFASFDLSLQERGIKGLTHASKLDKEIWDEFYNDWESLAFKSAKLLANIKNKSLEKIYNIPEEELPKDGKEKETLVKTRVNQSFFRTNILASYNFTCCITGLMNIRLLIASHIIPWSEDKSNRLNPRNGLCLNALHDRAFEYGLITITPDYTIHVSKSLKKKEDESVEKYFLKYDNKEIILPSRFLPDKKFLLYHNEKFKDQY